MQRAKLSQASETPSILEAGMSDQQLLKGKWVLVTGASKGLGASIAVTMAKQGGSVALMARSEDKLQDVCPI